MENAELCSYFFVFFVIGFSTYFFRAVFLYKYPRPMKNNTIRKGLESVPSSLLVAFVVPFTLFIDGKLLIWRKEVLAILLTIPIVWYLKKPGLSLILAIIILIGISFLF